MKNLVTKYAKYIIIILMFAILLPGLANRIFHENTNDNVTISFLYRDLEKTASEKTLKENLKKYLDEGINTVSVMEADLDYYDKMGYATIDEYHSFCQKYDAMSSAIASKIESTCPNVNPNSYVVVATKPEIKEHMAYYIPKKYTSDDYAYVGEFGNSDAYVFFDGTKEKWEYTFGYDKKQIKPLTDMGFDIVLVYKIKNYSVTKYIDDIEQLIKKYSIEYINLKKDTVSLKDGEKIVTENYEKFAEIINDNDMTLVLTENTDQLSNQKFLGYSYVFDKVMGTGGSQKVMRSLETHDETHMESPYYERRVEQFLNSTIDRNIRFITVTQLTPPKVNSELSSEYSFLSALNYKKHIEELGFRVNSDTNPQSYYPNIRLYSAASAVIMLMCLIIMFELITKKKSFCLNLGAIIISVLAFVLTFMLPNTLVSLYPTAFCMVQSCMAMTCLLSFLKTYKDRLNLTLLTLCSVAVLLAVLFLGTIGMGTMLSGIEYYVNNNIFRGIKLSLIVPVLYTAIIYYFVFIKKNKSTLLNDTKLFLNARIKVYWLILAALIIGVGVYYIIRSGNVSEISDIEQTLRSTLSSIFPARPRTKEFLIGYPALLLFVYYIKKTDFKFIGWFLAIASSILAASVTNSFCHVFTDYLVIATRTLNGLFVGIAFSAVIYIINLVIIKIIHAVKTEMK